MPISAIQSLVAKNPSLFESEIRENSESLDAAEEMIGAALPCAVRWFLSECGYCTASCIPNLQESIGETLRLRDQGLLPGHLIIVEDRGDAGVVLLDLSAEAGTVICAHSHDIERIADGALDGLNIDVYPEFSDWVAFRLEEEISLED